MYVYVWAKEPTLVDQEKSQRGGRNVIGLGETILLPRGFAFCTLCVFRHCRNKEWSSTRRSRRFAKGQSNVVNGRHYCPNGGIGTYKMPTPKMQIKPYFCRFGRLRLLSTGIGSTMMTRSVTMFMAALLNQYAI